MKHNLTFVIFAFNEARRIEYTLRCFNGYGKILVVDCRSTDNTVEIAKRYGADVIYRTDEEGWAEDEKTTNFIFAHVSTDWVYWGSVDELCTKTLLEKFVEISQQDYYKAVIVRRRNIHYGIYNLGLEHAYYVRMFKKGVIDFKNNRIHQFGRITCPSEEILYLPNNDKYAIYHFSTYNLEKLESNTNKYSAIEAEHNVKYGNKFSVIKLICAPLKIFIKYYLVNGGWRHGLHGFIMTINYCFFRFNTWAKTWEFENNITLETIEQKYDRLKEEFLKK